MKRHSILQVLGMLLVPSTLFLVGCNEDDPLEASDKTEYGADEAPYLRSDANAQTDVTLEFEKAKINEPVQISLADHAALLHTTLGMTVDETAAAVGQGSVVCHIIVPGRGCWDVTPAAADGWYFNTNGNRVDAQDTTAVFKAQYDNAKKAFTVSALNDPDAGVMSSFSLGLALAGEPNFDTYCRFNANCKVTDPSKVMIDFTIPKKGFTPEPLDLAKYEEVIVKQTGLSSKDLYAGIEKEDPTTLMFLLDAAGKFITDPGDANKPAPSTAGTDPGWWVDTEGKPAGWTDGTYAGGNAGFIELGGNGKFNIGYGTGDVTKTFPLRFALVVAEDVSRRIDFLLTVHYGE